jgi:type I restriction enzyme S subunit
VTGWKTVPLGDLAESVNYGVTASASAQAVGPKFLRISDIQSGNVNWESVPWCECDTRSASHAQLKPGDIVFARTGATTGKTFLIRECPPDAVFASYLIRVRVGAGVEPRFINHFFQTPNYWAQITKGARGAAQPGVNATTLQALKVPVPPLSEQRRIAEILDKADALRAKRRVTLAQIGTLTHSVFFDIFGDPAKNPRGWPTSSLGPLLRGITNGMTRRRAESDAGKSIVLRLRDIREGWIDFSDVNRITLTSEEASRYEVLAGDLLFIRVNGNPDYVGRCALFDGYAETVYFNDHVMRVNIDRSALDGVFLAFLLNGAYGKSEIAKHRKTSAGQHTINQDGLSRISFPLPPLPLQLTFAHRVADIERSKTKHSESLSWFDRLFASLQQRAFRGEL